MVETTYTAKVDLNQGVKPTFLNTIFAEQDANAHRIDIKVYRDGTAVSLNDANVNATFIRADGVTVALNGNASGNVASVTLTGSCYAKTGAFELAIKVVINEETSTVFYGRGSVYITSTGEYADEGTIPSISELLAQIDDMKAASAQAKTLVPTATAENLLDNNYFSNPVNQRGGVLYPASAGYKIDRWRTGSNTSLIVAPGAGMSIINEGTSVSGITQYIMDVRKEPYAGEWMTLACADNQGNIYCGSAIVPEGKFVTAFVNSEKGIHGNIYPEIVSESGSVTPARVQLLLQPGTQIILSWVALYRGKFTKDTLPPYTPKPYSLELAECQRYYFRTKGYNAFFGYCNSSTNLYLYATLPVPMRTTPTITLTDATLLARTGGGSHDGVTIVQAASMFGNLLRFQAKREEGGMTNGPAFAMVNNLDGVLEVSAEP